MVCRAPATYCSRQSAGNAIHGDVSVPDHTWPITGLSSRDVVRRTRTSAGDAKRLENPGGSRLAPRMTHRLKAERSRDRLGLRRRPVPISDAEWLVSSGFAIYGSASTSDLSCRPEATGSWMRTTTATGQGLRALQSRYATFSLASARRRRIPRPRNGPPLEERSYAYLYLRHSSRRPRWREVAFNNYRRPPRGR